MFGEVAEKCRTMNGVYGVRYGFTDSFGHMSLS